MATPMNGMARPVARVGRMGLLPDCAGPDLRSRYVGTNSRYDVATALNQRLLGAAAALQQSLREIRARQQLRDRQLNHPSAGACRRCRYPLR